jgi:hypothetical protein
MISPASTKASAQPSLTHFQPLEPPPASVLTAPSPRRIRRTSAVEPILADIDYWKNQALLDEPLTCDGELLIYVVAALRAERDYLLSHRLVPEAKAADQAMVRAREASTRRLKCQARDSLQADLRQKLAATQEEYDRLLETVNRQERNMKELFVREIQAMIDHHEEELEQLDAEWSSPAWEKKYSRTSLLLQILRQQAALLLKERKYDESRFVDTRADKMEQFETEEGHRKMEADYLWQLRLLEGRHEEEAEELMQKLNLKRGEWQAARDFEVNVVRVRLEKIEAEIVEMSDPEKVWVRYHRRETDPEIAREAGLLHKHPFDIGEYNILRLPPLRASMVAKHTLKKLNRSMKLDICSKLFTTL